MSTLPEIFSALTADAITLAHMPGAAVFGVRVAQYFRRRDEEARDIFFEELRCANAEQSEAVSQDDVIAVIYRYLRAAREGSARLNLRLLAKAIAGNLKIQTLTADEFLRDADALASLSRDEVVVVGELYRTWSERESLKAKNPNETFMEDPWMATKQTLMARGMDPDVIRSAGAMAQRTGLIFAGETVDDIASFRVSPKLIRLSKTVDFQDALRREETTAMS